MSLPNPHEPGCPWHSYAAQYGAPNIKWCEQTLCSWISEPANTWSNLAYIIAGVLIVVLYRRDRRTPATLFGAVVIVMGVGSFAYHMSNFYLTQVGDFVGMFGYTGVLVWLNLRRLALLKTSVVRWLGLAVVLAVSVASFPLFEIVGLQVQYTIVMWMAVIFLLEGIIIVRNKDRAVRDYIPYIVAMVLLGLARVMAYVDHAGIWCNPADHIFQGHAMWHVLSAASTYFTYAFYRERMMAADH